MIEIDPKLWIGAQADFEALDPALEGWAVVHACKEPHHRQALGYSGRGAPKEHPEYLMARRERRLILNLVDVDDPKYVAKEIMDAALEHIRASLADGLSVLCHCNQGASRSPTIGMLHLAASLSEDFDEAVARFKESHYEPYAPARGVLEFAREHWSSYRSPKESEASCPLPLTASVQSA